MKTAILTIALLLSQLSFAQEADVVCSNMTPMHSAQLFDIEEGNYVPSNTTNFCESYTIDQTAYASCSKDIQSLRLACNTSNWSAEFTCVDGVCKNSDGTRTVRIDCDNAYRVEYTKPLDNNSGKVSTFLTFKSPCN